MADRLFNDWEKERKGLFKTVKVRMEETPDLLEVWDKWQNAKEEQLAYEAEVMKELGKRPRFPLAEIEDFLKPEEQVEVIIPKETDEMNQSEQELDEPADDGDEKNQVNLPPANDIMDRLLQAAAILKDVPGFKKQAAELSARSLSRQIVLCQCSFRV